VEGTVRLSNPLSSFGMAACLDGDKLVIILQRAMTKQATTERFWTLPNILSLYRIFIFPYLLFFVFDEDETMFAIFITINLITDVLDGWIARTFHLETKIGAKLDSWADMGTYIAAFFAVYFFKWDVIRPHLFILESFFAIWLLSYLVVFIKFRGLIGLHTILFRITGWVQGGFIVCLFSFGFFPWFFYFSLIIGILACLEEIIIILIISRPMTNVKGLYWVLKNS
jgi:cardiolipin synthase